MTATIAALALDDSLTATKILIFTIATMFVFWLAHVYAELVSAHVVAGSRLSAVRLAEVIRSEWPIMQAAGPPSLALALAVVGVWSKDTGVTVALSTGVALPAGWGWLIGRLPVVVGSLVSGTCRSAIRTTKSPSGRLIRKIARQEMASTR